MDWSTTPPVLIDLPGWTTDPILPTPVVTQQWGVKYSRRGVGEGIGSDVARAATHIPVFDTGIGADVTHIDRVGGLIGADIGIGSDSSLFVPQILGMDQAVGEDFATSGLYAPGSAVATDSSLILPRYAVVDKAVGADMLKALPRIVTANSGIGTDAATNGFTPHAVAVVEYTSAGTYTFTIPVWCRAIDIVLCGGGEAGTNGAFITGRGGAAGKWAGITITRGVDIPWTAIAITIVVGAGGTGSGGDGAPSTASLVGWSGLSAAGGSGGNTDLIAQAGKGSGDFAFNGINYPGSSDRGGGAIGNGGSGNAPGGGGAGGGAPIGNGGGGAPGKAICRAYQ